MKLAHGGGQHTAPHVILIHRGEHLLEKGKGTQTPQLGQISAWQELSGFAGRAPCLQHSGWCWWTPGPQEHLTQRSDEVTAAAFLRRGLPTPESCVSNPCALLWARTDTTARRSNACRGTAQIFLLILNCPEYSRHLAMTKPLKRTTCIFWYHPVRFRILQLHVSKFRPPNKEVQP